ncbi:molecular chaperone TorD [Methylophaga sp. 42_25_T18]|nr:molecular chaperone TorD [Methylophaga sp. 42_25_T18]OUR88363.1 molecular chaperone TorD [Methylophaga sp. 42_8_T64]
MTEENRVWRAQTYALLARLLSAAPDKNLLENLIAIDVTEPDSPMGKQWVQLIATAKQADVAAVDDEYQRLFIGVTHGELMPYGSYYQTGFLMEEPLAFLRTDLSRLGLERQEDTAEPEDHIAAQCDVMRLILTAEGTPVVTEDEFFNQHLKPWVLRFFSDLTKADNAQFYRSIGLFGEQFMTMEMGLFD